jgi:hypothetical protein
VLLAAATSASTTVDWSCPPGTAAITSGVHCYEAVVSLGYNPSSTDPEPNILSWRFDITSHDIVTAGFGAQPTGTNIPKGCHIFAATTYNIVYFTTAEAQSQTGGSGNRRLVCGKDGHMPPPPSPPSPPALPPPPPGIGWYIGALGASCDATCAAASLACDQTNAREQMGDQYPYDMVTAVSGPKDLALFQALLGTANTNSGTTHLQNGSGDEECAANEFHEGENAANPRIKADGKCYASTYPSTDSACQDLLTPARSSCFTCDESVSDSMRLCFCVIDILGGGGGLG